MTGRVTVEALLTTMSTEALTAMEVMTAAAAATTEDHQSRREQTQLGVTAKSEKQGG